MPLISEQRRPLRECGDGAGAARSGLRPATTVGAEDLRTMMHAPDGPNEQSVTRGGTRASAVLLTVAALVISGCSDILRVTNPGDVQDSNLNTPAAAAGLVYGMSYAMSISLNNQIEQTGVVSQELYFTGSTSVYNNNGQVGPNDDIGTWDATQQARFVAEHGVARFKSSLGAQYGTNLYAARANLLAGLADRILGETFCQAIIDGGSVQDRSVYFQRAAQYFAAAAQIDQAAGDNSYVGAANGGLAAVHAWMGQWDSAAFYAQQVDSGYEYDALYNANINLTNDLASETHDRFAFSVFNTLYATMPDNDPRTPWDTVLAGDGSVQISADGHTPAFQQQKYAGDGDPVPLVRWQEMLMLLAESRLVAGDVPGAVGYLNRERAYYRSLLSDTTSADAPPTLQALAAGISIDSAWTDLRYDRGAVLWLEGRRLWDLARWNAATGPAHDGQLAGRTPCFPISSDEKSTNPNTH
jgi:starch-binding outer membrane protein, SusD/RagB family